MKNRREESVKDRLKNIARKTDTDYNFICIQYLQERFLARLEESTYRENFVLKGALLLIAYNIPAVRPSKDIDFLGQHTSNDIDKIKLAIQEIAEIDLKDGVTFIPEEIDIEQITEHAEYGGIRARLTATVGGDRHRLQLDIGFGDSIVDGPVDMDYPAMLDYSSPNIKVYSLESAIAEKLEAIVSLGTFGSRMKDYFDVWFLIDQKELSKDRLQKAIQITFEKRNTAVDDFKFIFSNNFKRDQEKEQQWQAFLNRNSMEITYSFKDIVEAIESFIKPIV